MVELLDRSPLQVVDTPFTARVINLDGLHLSELPRQGVLRLQGKAEELAAAVNGATGLDLPAVNGFTGADPATIIWIGPGRWLVRMSLSLVPDMTDRLARGLGDTPHLLSDASHQYVSFTLSGVRANDFLQRVCSLDPGAPGFVPGAALRTLFGRLPVLLEHMREGPEYRLTVDQSLARYAWDWFTAIFEDVRDTRDSCHVAS